MKSFDQIYRYVIDCSFSPEDWLRIKEYCQEHFKGYRIYKATQDKPRSTFNQFLEWVESGFGSGDYVSYGNTSGIVCKSTPDGVVLAVYCDYFGKLIIRQMNVRDLERLKPLDEDRTETLQKNLADMGLMYYAKTGRVDKIYTPQKYYYVVVDDGKKGLPDVGMWLESDGCKHKFAAYLRNHCVFTDYWIDIGCTPLKAATPSDIRRLHQAVSESGIMFNERLKVFVPKQYKTRPNRYWYLNDRFEIVQDYDNGDKKHKERFNVGNYFIDNVEALMFMGAVLKIREES